MENLIEKLNRLSDKAKFVEELTWDTQKKYPEATLENVVLSKIYYEASCVKRGLAGIIEQLKQEAADEEQAVIEIAQESHDREQQALADLEPADDLPF